MKTKTRNYVMGGVGGTLLAAGTIALINQFKVTPKGITPVKPFDLKKYMGTWYEIARMKNRFEKDLKYITAEYSLNENGTVKVINKGFNPETEKYEEVTGQAILAGEENEAKLKVSFFGPLYSGYNVVKIDPEYKYALVAGKNRRYLWLLSRDNDMPPHIRKEYLQEAMRLGYDISNLTWPIQRESQEEDEYYLIIGTGCEMRLL